MLKVSTRLINVKCLGVYIDSCNLIYATCEHIDHISRQVSKGV